MPRRLSQHNCIGHKNAVDFHSIIVSVTKTLRRFYGIIVPGAKTPAASHRLFRFAAESLQKYFFEKMPDNSFPTSIKCHTFAFQKVKGKSLFNYTDMTKADIVNEVSKNTGVDRRTVMKTVESLMDSVKKSLAQGENVYLRGFGSFVVKKRAQKTARNISKNTTIIIPEHNIPSFKPAKTFLNDVK